MRCLHFHAGAASIVNVAIHWDFPMVQNVVFAMVLLLMVARPLIDVLLGGIEQRIGRYG